MRTKLLFISLIWRFCFLTYQGHSQEEVLVSLAYEQIEIPGLPYYVEEVIDARPNKSSLGIASIGLLNKKVPIRFDIGFERSLMEYLRTIRPRDTLEQKALILRIKQLKVEEVSDINASYGAASLEADLIYRTEGRLVKLGEASFAVQEPAINISKTHERRIRYLLYQCLSSLITLEDKPGFTRSFEPFSEEKLRTVDKKSTRLKQIEVLGSGKRKTDFKLNGMPISNSKIEQMIRDSGSGEAMALLKRSKRTMGIGALASGIGGGLIAFTLGSYITGGIFYIEPVLAGGAGLGLGVVFNQMSRTQLRRAVEIYNESLRKQN